MTEAASGLRSRRALLGASVGTVAALGAQAVLRPLAVSADGEAMLTGGSYSVTGTTTLTNSTGDNAVAFHGHSAGSTGVYGSSVSFYGVGGDSAHGTGVFGSSTTRTGVLGYTSAPDNTAIRGWAGGGNSGVVGHSGNTVPESPTRTGVYGYAGQVETSAKGVFGEAPNGRGVVAKGGAAQLRLVPSQAENHPASGQKGDLFVDADARLWFCRGGTTWVRLA